ncbi:GGDEF domain-containing protein [Halomonas sp. MC140]|nr:diguanylate cyclase [Halomonas sp. MC140]MDN7131861.1 GGDEF domain-containing protein [Halomonas sp. MC140]
MPDQSAELLRSAALQISAAVLKHRDQETLRLNELALTDGLTGVANRRSFDELLGFEWKRCQRNQLPLSVVFIDIDFFKRYNDFYGHLQGDECLKAIAFSLKAVLNRPGDLVARYGGEEFICLLPETDLFGASHKAEELELAVRKLTIPHDKSEVAPVVTISLGVATAQQVTGEDPSALVSAADELLYQAKAEGRGCYRAALLQN